MENLKSGLTGTASYQVAREHCTSRGGPWVFSTPAMVKLTERSCHELVAPLIGEGRHTVGTVVNIRHIAPTPEGMQVRIEMELAGVDRRRLSFKAKIYDEVELVGECEHERFVIDVARAGEKLARKIEMLKR